LSTPPLLVHFIHTVIQASFRSFYSEYTLLLFCNSVRDIGLSFVYLVLEKLPKILVFLPSSPLQLFYIFYPKYVFHSFASFYLAFLNNFVLQIYEIFSKEISHSSYKS